MSNLNNKNPIHIGVWMEQLKVGAVNRPILSTTHAEYSTIYSLMSILSLIIIAFLFLADMGGGNPAWEDVANIPDGIHQPESRHCRGYFMHKLVYFDA